MQDKGVLSRFMKAQESLVVQHSDFSLSAIFEMVNSESINIEPHYQRRERWMSNKQSALIESFLLNVPVPPVYLSEDDYGTYSVIDGKQRLTSIREFLSGRLKLKDLKEFPELNGFTFQELPSQLKNALTVRPYIRVITLLKQSDPELKFEVFLRLNTGGEKLKAQEVRNVAFSGPLNDLLYELADDDFLKQKMKITSEKSTYYKNMDDLEHVLRFFTIADSWQEMGKILAVEMDRFMSENRNPNDIAGMRQTFTNSIRAVEAIWGNMAFNKPLNNGWRDQFISPLYDAQMVAVSMLSNNQINALAANSQAVLNETTILFRENQEFVKSVSQSTNNASSVRKRVGDLHTLLLNISRR
ncbi:MAG: DUF262 domain-containing protein [Geobacter sp.]|nr:MAG: DUF262 domain-containing protein [Geobacter sp.]